MDIDIFVTFYDNRDDFFITLWKKVHRFKYDHCSVVLRAKGFPSICLHTYFGSKPKFVREKYYHKKMQPLKAYYIGKTDLSFEEIRSVIEGGKKFSIYKYFFWYYFTRWWLKWKPRWVCTTMVCRILKKCKLYDTYRVIPDKLNKELSDADSFYSWTSGDG
jgi:hypothetical protein